MSDISNKTAWVAMLGTATATALVTFLVTHYAGKGVETVEEGAAALEAQQIRTIVSEELTKANAVIINGETLTTAEALSKIATEQAVMRAALEAMVPPE